MPNANRSLLPSCRHPRSVVLTATFDFLENYLNAWEVKRNSGGNQLQLRRLTSQDSGKTLDSLVLHFVALEVSGDGDGDPERPGGSLCDLRGGPAGRRTA